MRLLLDTHIALWIFVGSPKIDPIKDTILSPETEVFISAASWWELAIKIGIGKFDADLKVLRWAANESGFNELPIRGEHTEYLLKLPPMHKDPFDRILVAQSMVEPMRLITADETLLGYTELVWSINSLQ